MRVGIIGCGGVAERHLIPLRRLTGVEIVGVADPNESNAQAIARLLGIRHIYRDAESLLNAQRPDVVHILTPPQFHRDLSIPAMEAGCHVFVEKPMALNVEEADEMIAASRHHGVTLGVCHNHLFLPAVIEAQELVARGALGTVVGAEVYWRAFRGVYSERYRKATWLYKLPGGVLHEPAPHPVYLLRAFVDPLRIIAVLSKPTGSDPLTPSEDLHVLVEGETGVGSMTISTSTGPKQRFLRVHGTVMSIHIDLATNTLVKFRTSGTAKLSKALANLDHGLQLLSKTIAKTLRTLLGRGKHGHEILIERFYESLRQGTDPPVTGEDGRAVVAVLDHIWSELAVANARREAE